MKTILYLALALIVAIALAVAQEDRSMRDSTSFSPKWTDLPFEVEREKFVPLKEREGSLFGEEEAKESPRVRTLDKFNIFIDGFHLDPENLCMQMEAQHYCNELNDDLTQCILFDKTGERLQGMEYIISRELFSKLPDEERGLWHSHRYEVASGLLHMELNTSSPMAKRKALEKYVDTYGKIFHIFGEVDDVPLGVPKVLMSFTHKKQLLPGTADASSQIATPP